MQRVVITWAPDVPEVQRVADELKAALEGAETAVSARPQASSSFADIAAADLVVFGVGTSDGALPPDYGGLVRICAGANLAAKAAACFSVGGERASAELRRHLKLTGIALLEEEPAHDRLGRTEVRAWAARVVEFWRGTRDGRR